MAIKLRQFKETDQLESQRFVLVKAYGLTPSGFCIAEVKRGRFISEDTNTDITTQVESWEYLDESPLKQPQ